ncbi:MAG TPA: SMC family ATPase [Candidatus Thermoplasmatota archaeon]|nr:SMC family ATPase [Candidatus Thermoplasmatota archaeon]
MRLHSVSLENYRRFRAVTIEIPDGVTAVIGENGAGKSTFVEAVVWALFGEARTEKELVRRRDAGAGEDCSVTVRFEHAGHAYEVVRRLAGARSSHTALLAVDGVAAVAPGAHSAREVAAYMERALHMDSATFLSSLVAQQKDLAGLSALRPAERKAAVLRMLRVDVVDEAVRLAREAKRFAQREAELLAGGPEPKELEAREAAARADATRLRAAHAAAAAAAEALRLRAEEARATVDARTALQERHRQLSDRLATLRAAEEGARRDEAARLRDHAQAAQSARDAEALAAGAPDLAVAREAVATLQAARAQADARRRAEREVAEAEARLARVSAELPALDRVVAEGVARQQELTEVRTALEVRRAELAALDARFAGIGAEHERARKDLSEARGRLDELRRLGPDAPCPTCERPLHDCHDGLVGRLAAESVALETAIRDLEQRRAIDRRAAAEASEAARAAEVRARDLDAAVRAALQAEARRAEVAQRLASDRARLTEARERLASFAGATWTEALDKEARARLASAEVHHQKLALARGHAARLPEAETALGLARRARAEAEAARVVAEREVAALGFDPAALAAAQRASHDALRTEHAKRLEAETARAAAERAEADAGRWAEERVRAAERERARGERLRDVALLERLAGDRDAGLLPDFKLHLASRIRPLLQAEASVLYRDATDDRYPGMELDEDYELRVVDDGAAFPLARMSGGEADLANLCLRLAVGRVLADRAGAGEMGFLVLDEVFGSQDDGRQRAILRVLGALSSRFRQILLVTHIDGVKDAVDHVLRVEDGPDGSAVVTVEA